MKRQLRNFTDDSLNLLNKLRDPFDQHKEMKELRNERIKRGKKKRKSRRGPLRKNRHCSSVMETSLRFLCGNRWTTTPDDDGPWRVNRTQRS